MKWYEGNIAEAVTLSRKNNAVFVVYIQGTSDLATNLNQLLTDNIISSTLSSSSFVAIKVDAGSVPHQQFSEIYKDTPIPSIYFIGKTGTPLEIIKDIADQDSFMQKVTNILQRNGTPIPDVLTSVSNNPSPSDSTPSTSSSSSFIATEQTNTDDICTIKPNDIEADDKSEAENKPELSHDDKVALAKELIEKKRNEKQKDDEEKEKVKEIDRRKMGQEVQNLQRWQKDQELKQLMNDRAKVKNEEKIARQRILDQIAQDKADRATKFAPTVNEPKEPSPTVIRRAPANVNTARLQFRLADGSTRTHDFDSTATLAQVRSYVRDTLQLTSCKLSMAFPRREFTTEDDESTLVDLSLVPNAVLLVLPSSGGAGSNSGGGGILATGGAGSGLVAMLWSLFTPILNVLGWLKSLLFGGGAAAERTARSGETAGSDGARAAEKRAASPGDSNRLGESSKRKSGDVIQRHGNIHRLTDPNDSDDDNNTWNGNSTQQM